MKQSLKWPTDDSPLPIVLQAHKKQVFHLWEIWGTHTVSPQKAIQFLLPEAMVPPGGADMTQLIQQVAALIFRLVGRPGLKDLLSQGS